MTNLHYVFLATVNGVMKKTSLKEFAVNRSVGKAAIALDDGDSILTAVITDGTQDIMVFGSNGKVLRFDENEVRPMGRAARGVLTMKLPEGHQVHQHVCRARRYEHGSADGLR